MTRSALFLLDEKKPLGTGGRVGWTVGVAAYVAVTAFVCARPDAQLPPVAWVPVAHALVLAIICGFTAMLMVGQATTSGRRGYLWLGGTYLYVACVLLAFPLFFPGALRDQGPLLGSSQSAITLFYVWHLAFPLGLAASIWVLGSDRRRHRRPDLRTRVWPTLAIVGVVVVITLAVVSLGHDSLPSLLDASGKVTGLATFLDRSVLALSIALVALAAYTAWGGAQIQRWLLAVTILLLGEAVVNQASGGRWTFAWYFDRLFGMVALTALFLALLWLVVSAGRATNRLATSDALTGSENRASFTRTMDEELAAACADGRAVALLWIDLDGFKSVNDELGHAIGDEVLRRTVRRIQSHVRAGDHLGRLGGDEFGVLLCDDVRDAQVSSIAERILASLREPITIEESTTLLSGSIGVATAPQDATHTEDLLTSADLAMYAAKNAGGDRYQWFSEDLADEALGRAHMRHELASAVRNNEFALDYQPIVVPGTGAVVGYEALVRWLRGGERVAAIEFIGFAERSGQIIPIGRRVIDLLESEVPLLLAGLPADGFITFNLSVQEIADEAAVQRLMQGPLAACATHLVVEVTESQELLSADDAERNLGRLREAGYRLGLDDFGAGFSNFARLERLHPSLLKIDRSLIARAGIGVEGGVAFLTAAIGVARSLHAGVVAEGVETNVERAIVTSLDIPFAQGFLYGPPQPASPTVKDGGIRDPATTA